MSCEPDSWEELEQLTLEEHPTASLPPPRKDEGLEGEPSTETECKDEDAPEGDSIDQALKEALKNPRERANVLRIDADVHKFISDKTRCTIEFSYDLTSYQTSSVPLGNGLSRVIAHKTQETKAPAVRVVDVMDVYCPPESAKKTVPPEVMIKRRELGNSNSAGGQGNGNGGHLNKAGGHGRTVKQREEEYKAARDRILGDAQHVEGEEQQSADEEDGKNSKAVFRDREKELQDPDYRRGAPKCYQKTLYDTNYGDRGGTYGAAENTGNMTAGVYNTRTYNSEFPALPGGATSLPQRPYPPPTGQHVFVHGEQPMAAAGAKPGFVAPPPMNFAMANSVGHPGMGAVSYPTPMAHYPFPPQPRLPPYRMPPSDPMTTAMAVSSQGQPATWKHRPGVPVQQQPSVVSTAPAPPHPCPPQNAAMYAAVPPYGSPYPSFRPRTPYVAAAQRSQQKVHASPAEGGAVGHMHQMTTIRRKPMTSSQNEGGPQTDR